MKKTVIIRLANLNIMVSANDEMVLNFLKDYLFQRDALHTGEEAKTERIDIVCYPTENEIQEEILRASEPVSQPQAEISCIYRRIAEELPSFEKLVCHGAAISYKGNGYIFIAPSNTGKSTHIKLWKDVFQEDTVIINGDKPIIDLSQDEAYVWGTPWAGKEGWNQNTKAPLKGICLIRQGKDNHIKKAVPADYAAEVYQQVYRPAEQKGLEQTIALLNRLFCKIPFYVMDCNIHQEAAVIAKEYLTKAIMDSR